MAFMEEFEHLKIRLEVIKSATRNFDDSSLIGSGGFGKVYKGEISNSNRQRTVAFKRLDARLGQGDFEFRKEILMLSRHVHRNLISLLGFCDEDGEKILVYEYASRGSLDGHLSSTTLTWKQRLNICLSAAKGISYLHDPRGTHQRVIHRDVKSSNILLDQKWNAKVSDFGLSKVGPANLKETFLFSNVAGTHGYLDPEYLGSYCLTKESDVYSFGVVLVEVLCGRLCFEKSVNGQFRFLVCEWKQSYKEKKLDEIIFQHMKYQLDERSLKIFLDITFRCLHKSRKKRPLMADVVKQLEIALELQEIYEGVRLPDDYEDMIKTEVPLIINLPVGELKMLFFRGILFNGGKTWRSINKNGEHCEMISIAECLVPDGSGSDRDEYMFGYNSRFVGGCYKAFDGQLKTHIRTQFLSPRVTYTVNLVFKLLDQNKDQSKPTCVAIGYNLEGETKYSISYFADAREDGWLMAELYQFTSDHRIVDLEIVLGFLDIRTYLIEGFEFWPLEKMDHEALEDEKADVLPISDSDAYWEQKLPKDYEHIILSSKDEVQWTTMKELYSILCKGFLINNGEEWFFLAQYGKKCHMLPARAVLNKDEWEWHSLLESRFEEVALDPKDNFSISCDIISKTLSHETTYAAYLVYKLQENHSRFELPFKVIDKDLHTDDFWYVYLLGPQTPVIEPKDNQDTHNPLNRPKMKGFPRLRNDGWMEVQVWEFRTSATTEQISKHFLLRSMHLQSFHGLIVQGIEFKPV